MTEERALRACELKCTCSATGSREIGKNLNSEVVSRKKGEDSQMHPKHFMHQKAIKLGLKLTAPVGIMSV